MSFRSILTAALAALTLAMSGPLAAQEAVIPTNIVADQVTDDQVEAFVIAMVAIERIRAQFTPKIQAEKNAEDRRAIINEADVAAMKAVENTGDLSAEDYLGIGHAAQQNKALKDRILARIEDMKAE